VLPFRWLPCGYPITESARFFPKSRYAASVRDRGGAGVFFADRLIDVDGGQDTRGCSLNPTERLGQRGAIAAIQVDVVAGRVGDVEAECVSSGVT
jgi:hypothetical protein